MTVEQLVAKFVTIIVNPILLFLFAIALLVFMWGLVDYLYHLNVKGEVSDEGKQHMLWGIIGMFIMSSAYALVVLLGNTICNGGLNGCFPKF